LHRALIVIAMLGAIAVAGCTSGGSNPSASIPPDVDLAVAVKDFTFHPAELTLTAGEPTTLYFENLDSEKHDIAIFPDANTSTAMFDGEDIGRGSIVYDVPAFEAGKYFFKCTIHPVMSGNVQVAP
jgi:plastocyanin